MFERTREQAVWGVIDTAREKKDGHYINYYIDRENYEHLEKYANDKGRTVTAAIERIVKAYLDENENNLK